MDVATTETASLVVLGVLALVAVAVVVLFTKIASKVIAVAVIVALGVVVYSQRAALADCPVTCACSFFGYELEIGDETIDNACRDVVSRVRTAVD